MQCIKTGCHTFLLEYGEYIYGDAFYLGPIGGTGNYVFRVCERSFLPLQNVLHFTVREIDHWFDYEKTSQERNSTLIARVVDDWGYKGKAFAEQRFQQDFKVIVKTARSVIE